jgi:lipoprotein-anchoring transpeptidase ErfK/SrfK
VRRALAFAVVALAPLLGGGIAHADEGLPPWVDPDDVPLQSWVTSATPKRDDTPVFVAPGDVDQKRGTLHHDGVRLPIFGAKRAGHCTGRWLLVGPMAWVCSDAVELSPDPPGAAPRVAGTDGLLYRYFFAGKAGAQGFLAPAHVEDETPDFELDPGFVVATLGEQLVSGERMVRTRAGAWVRMRDLGAAHPSAFQGERVANGALDFGWVLPERATVWDGVGPKRKAAGVRLRFEKVQIAEERTTANGVQMRITQALAGAQVDAWMSSRDVARPTTAPLPADVAPNERWIDVELATQTLVAYEGTTPVFATLVSTGTGAQGTDTATPKGAHRIWVKLETSDMDNLERADPEPSSKGLVGQDEDKKRYSIEDVPYVQFFDGAVGLHGAFWHSGFGRVRSHGCVNLAPLDARWLFQFTGPHLPAGWSAVLPTKLDRGTMVRVR